MDDSCGAAWLATAAGTALAKGPDARFSRVETDSRSAGPGCLFVALKGERADGHDHAAAAAASGAAAILVSEAWWRSAGAAMADADPAFRGVAVVAVPDPLKALQAAASAWRSRFCARRIGVTGSSGKTTVKELIASILSVSHSVVRNPGNLNSDIGLPASVFLMRPSHEYAVFEMGINAIGEMDVLAGIFRPDCALINNIGTAHIGLLGGTRLGIASEKKKICSRFDGGQDLVVHEDDEFRDFLVQDVRGRCHSFGPRSVRLFEGARSLGLAGWSFRYAGTEATLSLPGAHNLLNALAAARVAELHDVPPEEVREGLAAVKALSGRSEILEGPVTVVNDCYNANAESTLAALAFCDEADCAGRRVYVLGSMKELGSESRAAHARVGEAAARSRADVVLFFGEEARDAFDAASALAPAAELRHHLRFDDLARDASAIARPGDIVLLKASRSMELERLADILAGRGGTHVP